MKNNNFQMIPYSTAEEDVSINAYIKDETIWLTQKSMAELFDVNVPAVNKHMKNIYDDGELLPDSTISKMEIVQKEGTQNVERLVGFSCVMNSLTALNGGEKCER